MTLQQILTAAVICIAAWFALSIPVGLVVGRFIAAGRGGE